MSATLTKKQAIKCAREEVARWNMSPGVPMAILWAFIHYAFNGETIEETFFGERAEQNEPDIFP